MKNKFKKIDLGMLYTAGIIVLINLISLFYFFRIDLTEGNIYSLSDASKKIMEGLDDKVIVKCFFSEELPPELKDIPTLIKDNLDEYKTYSNGNLQYEFISPSDPEFSEQIQDHQLPSAQVQMLEQDEFKVKRIFMGMILLYEDKKEIIPFVQRGDLPTLEYELTSKIKKLTSDKLPAVGLLSDFGTVPPEDIRTVYQLLSEQYVLKTVKATEEELDPDKISALLILSPSEKFSDEGLKAVDNYIVSGGKTAFFIDKISADIQKQQAENIELNLDSLMYHYGIKVNNDLIGDMECGAITMRQQKGFFQIANQVKYPFLPVITEFDRSEPVTKNIENVSLYFASSLDTAGVGSDIEMNLIAKTSESSFIQENNYSIMAGRNIDEYEYNAEYVPVMASLKGSFNSFYDSSKKGIDTRLVVSGDGEFFQEKFITSEDNINLFLNLTDWLTAEDELISIRSKVITQRPLDEVEPTGKMIIKILNIALIPLLLTILGIIKWQRGKRRKDFSLKQ